MRRLLLAELVFTALVSTLLFSSPTIFAYYQLGGLAHIGIAALVFVLLRQHAYWLLIGLSAIALPLALILLPPHFGALDLFLILWTLGGLPLIGAALLGRQITPQTFPFPRLLLIVVIVVGCIISLRSIRAFPNFSATDEAMIYNYVDTFERRGKIEASLIPYPAPVVTGNLYVYAAELWTNVFRGDPFALRNFSALGGFVLIMVVFATARALRDALTGWIAAALLATNLLWLAVSHVVRQEIWLAVFVWLSVWLSLQARKRASGALALLAGLIVTLSADVHPLGALACVALGVWWIAQSRLKRRLLLLFILGGLIGTASYLVIHVLPDPTYFLAGVRDELFSYGAEGSTPLGAMIARHLNYLQSNPLEVALLLGCTLWGLRQQEARWLGIFIGALMLLYALLVADPNLYYPMVWIPGLVILAAIGLQTVAWHKRAPLMVAFLAAFVFNTALIERHINADWNERALNAIQQVAAHVPNEGRGTGESFLYLALRDPSFIGFTFVNIWARDAGISRWQIVETLKPDWIVTVRDENAFTPPFSILSVDVPNMHLEIPDAALAEQYHLSTSIETSVGSFEIWQRS